MISNDGKFIYLQKPIRMTTTTMTMMMLMMKDVNDDSNKENNEWKRQRETQRIEREGFQLL